MPSHAASPRVKCKIRVEVNNNHLRLTARHSFETWSCIQHLRLLNELGWHRVDDHLAHEGSTGCFFSMSKVICLWESLKIQNMSWYWCFHFTEIGPFWDLVLKKFHNHSVIIHLWRLRRCIIAKISKIHWKSMIKKHQYCFANISATEARIFMKFYMVVNYYLVILCIKFHSDWCINARARVEL